MPGDAPCEMLADAEEYEERDSRRMGELFAFLPSMNFTMYALVQLCGKPRILRASINGRIERPEYLPFSLVLFCLGVYEMDHNALRFPLLYSHIVNV